MSSDLVADFVAMVHAPPFEKPCQGRVLMRADHIVCVTDDLRVDVPLSSVFDIGTGTVPMELRDFFDDSITLAYDAGDTRQTVVLEARAESMETFRTILFKCLLMGESVRIKSPAKRGGHVLDTQYEAGKLAISPGSLSVHRPSTPVTIDLDTISTFAKGRGDIGGQSRRIISVGHLEGGTVVTTNIAPDAVRVLSILGRYLKLEYTRLHQEVVRMDLDHTILQALVALDAGATQLEGMVPGVEDEETLLDELREAGLVVQNGEGMVLSRRGRMATKTHMESVN